MEVLDSLLSVVRRCCEGFPDKRTGTNSQYTMADIGLAALSVFFTQSPSFLDHQRQLETGHGRSNCQTLGSASAAFPPTTTSATCSIRWRPITSFRRSP